MRLTKQVNESGKFSNSARNETQLVCDILGLESLVDAITFAAQASSSSSNPHDATSSAILGPFWRANAPIMPMGSSIVGTLPLSCGEAADHTYLHGTITSAITGKPIQNAELDIWHTAPNGLYEQQDPEQDDMNLRGRFLTGPDGKYSLYCLRPTSYPIPYDGPAGHLLKLLDRHPMRPAHIHFIVTAKGFRPLTTQIFDRRDEHIKDDAVFAVKESLVCDFLPKEGDEKATFQLEYDFKLVEESV
jgi:catechol 1,2-dioxygenase